MMIRHLETEEVKGLDFWGKVELREKMIKEQDLTGLNLNVAGDELRELLQKIFVHAISKEEFEMIQRCMSRNKWDINSLLEVHSRRPNVNMFQIVSCQKGLI